MSANTVTVRLADGRFVAEVGVSTKQAMMGADYEGPIGRAPVETWADGIEQLIVVRDDPRFPAAERDRAAERLGRLAGVDVSSCAAFRAVIVRVSNEHPA